MSIAVVETTVLRLASCGIFRTGSVPFREIAYTIVYTDTLSDGSRKGLCDDHTVDVYSFTI